MQLYPPIYGGGHLCSHYCNFLSDINNATHASVGFILYVQYARCLYLTETVIGGRIYEEMDLIGVESLGHWGFMFSNNVAKLHSQPV